MPERSERAPARDLSQDDANGGHTLARHVGQSDAELRDRLERQQSISAASSYYDRSTAEQAISAAIANGRPRIDRWLAREGGHPNLVLDYDSPRPLGRTMHRGESSAVPCAHALVVLRWDGGHQYHVLTSYPECR